MTTPCRTVRPFVFIFFQAIFGCLSPCMVAHALSNNNNTQLNVLMLPEGSKFLLK